MPLDSSALSTLTSGIMAALSLGVVPPPNNASSDEIALAIAAAYHAYAANALSCGGVAPSLVYFDKLQDGLKSALSGSNPDPETAAEKWHDAFEEYWTNAQFGGTGLVMTISGGAAFETGMAALFTVKTNTMAVVAQQMATLMDTYTKTVMVKDTAVPPPTGCGPLPIS